MNIAIDYDDTYTLDPCVWEAIIQLLKDNGHNVFCVTKRYECNADDIKENIKSVPIIFTPRGLSKSQMVRLKGIKIDVWVDNSPSSIVGYYGGAENRLNKGFARW